jgi:spore maturation protein CgeB
MERHLRAVRDDADLRASLVQHGLETILACHTCSHRADELLAILGRVAESRPLEHVA